MKNLVAIIFCVIALSTQAKETKWFQGVVVLADGLVLNGELALQEVFEMVLFRDSNGLRVLPAHRVAEVRYYDYDSDINRHFVSIEKSGPRLESNLYEVVLEGQVRVLRKVKRLHSKEKSDRFDYHYYVAGPRQMVNLKQFRSKVYPDLVKDHPAIIAYQRRHKLNPNLPGDAILLIGYCNDFGSDRIITRK